MKMTMTTLATLAALAVGSSLTAQAGYYGGGGGGGRGPGGFLGDLGAGSPNAPPPRPPLPEYRPGDSVRTNLDTPSSPRGNVPGPTTGGTPSVPTLPAAGGIARAPQGQSGLPTQGGIPMDFRRDDETLRHFAIDWNFPRTPKAAQPLAWERAVAALAGDDPRPLLVRRRGHAEESGREARIEAFLDGEEMRVLSRFFRCVDLPDATRHPQHVLSGLYVPEQPPLLFVTTADGVDPIGFSGQEPANLISDVVVDTIARAYSGNVDSTVKGIRRLIEDYDRLLPRERELLAAVDDAVAEHGDKAKATARQRERLAKVQAELAAVRKREAALTESLELRSKAASGVR
ncbi:MAG: hypothetical protein AB7I19_00050 [Planctomycetota bacterium]